MTGNAPIGPSPTGNPLKPNSVEKVQSEKRHPNVVTSASREQIVIDKNTAKVIDHDTAPAGVLALESTLPIAILKSPYFLRAEWAWRRQIYGDLERSNGTETPAQPPSRTGVVTSLWRQLETMADEAGAAEWEVSYPGVSAPNPLVPFSAIRANERSNGWHVERVRRWVLRDRMVAAVRAENAPVVGEGMFVQTVIQPQDQQPGRVKAYRWRAERDSRETSEGRVVHRLHFELRVHGSPVHLDLIFCKPALSVHIATDSAVLRNAFDSQFDELRKSIGSAGWSVERLSSGSLEQGGEATK